MGAKQPPVDYGKGRLLLPNEAAAMLRLDSKTLGRWAKAGYIPSIVLPSRHRRYWEADVKAMLAYTPAQLPRPPRKHSPTKAVSALLLEGQLELPLPGPTVHDMTGLETRGTGEAMVALREAGHAGDSRTDHGQAMDAEAQQ